MAKRVQRKWLRFRGILLTGLLALMGLAFTGCPPVVMYGPPAPEYGVPAAKEAPVSGQQDAQEAPGTTKAAE